MNEIQALQILIHAVNMAQSKGAYKLKEAAVISKAVEIVSGPTNNQNNAKDKEEEDDNEN
jgi:hypothetical protein